MSSTYTLRDVITASLRLIMAIDSNQTVDGSMIADGLYTAQEILDSWNTEGGMIYSQTLSTFPILAQKTVYTIGPDLTNGVNPPDFIVPNRPQNLLFASFQPPSVSPVIDLPLKIVDSVEYAQVIAKKIGSGVPQLIYLDYTYPVGNLYLWNQPNQGGNLVLTYWNQLPSFGLTLDTVFTTTFPPGYMRLLRYEIAMNLAPEFGKPIPVDVATVADGIKRNIMINNTTSEFATYNVPTGPGVYDAVSGQLYK